MENQKRILIVEDSPTVVEHMKMLLRNSNVKVLNAGSEFGMMQSIESYGKIVDLILMDLTLKAENGMDLIKNLRTNERYNDLPIIIITEHANKDLILEARKLKVCGYLKKPIEKESFLDRIYEVIGNVSLVPRKTDTDDDVEDVQPVAVTETELDNIPDIDALLGLESETMPIEDDLVDPDDSEIIDKSEIPNNESETQNTDDSSSDEDPAKEEKEDELEAEPVPSE